MDARKTAGIGFTACPHDCPSTCALEVELLDNRSIGRVRGSRDNAYTCGVICAKVARYAERVHHPDRLTRPLRRIGARGEGRFEPVSWDTALDIVAENLLAVEARHGAAAIWPYYYAGTMGLVQRDCIHRLRHAKRYSGQLDTICASISSTGFIAGTGLLAGPDPREMARSDCIVIWGTNAAATQVNVLTHAVRARKEHGAAIVAIDIYRTPTVEQADLPLILRPGTDAALACAVMHVAFRDGYADRDYLARYTDAPERLEAHLQARSPEWAAAITGLSVAEIEEFAALLGRRPKTYFRLGFGFTRHRNGAVAMHAACSLATVLGAWRHEGGGAFHSNGGIYRLDNTMVTAADSRDPSVRLLDQSRIGEILTGSKDALAGGPPVAALFVQNTNPLVVAPDQERVRAGFGRDDLFICVHEQFMTETARFADIVLPATMFLEHDDIYRGGGHQYLLFGPKLIDPPGECRSNNDLICALGERLGASHPGFSMTAREHIDWMLRHSGLGGIDGIERAKWIDCQPDFESAHYLNGFATEDGKFHFMPDWTNVDCRKNGMMGPWRQMPSLPDHWPVTEPVDDRHPFRLATSPARNFLNTSFNNTPTSLKREGRPTLLIHPDDAALSAIEDGDEVVIGNDRGRVRLHARLFDGLCRGVLIAEGIWANAAHPGGRGINVLTGSDPVAPHGGAAFHDNSVWLRRATHSAEG